MIGRQARNPSGLTLHNFVRFSTVQIVFYTLFLGMDRSNRDAFELAILLTSVLNQESANEDEFADCAYRLIMSLYKLIRVIIMLHFVYIVCY